MFYGGPAHPMGMSSIPVHGGSEEHLREFIAAHLGRSVMPGGGDTVVTIGQIPDESAFADFPLPDSLRVIGTVDRSQLHSELLLHTTAEIAGAEIVEQLVAGLVDAGWENPSGAPISRGFVAYGAPAAESRRLCHAQRKLVMQITASADGLVSITIHKQRNPCEDPHQSHLRTMNALPMLMPPQNIPIEGFQHGSGGSSNGSVHTSARIQTSARLADIAPHYHKQLEAAGWTLVHSHLDDHIAASTWRAVVDDEDWQGVFLVMPVSESGAMHLRLEIHAADI